MRLKLVENAPQGHGKKQALIALNINELDLLAGMAEKLSQSLPKSGPSARLQNVAKGMRTEMRRAIAELEKEGIDERSKQKYPYDDRSVI